ncbi:hydroxymyristoyl-ACP dehydratase [Aquincola sp. S2]|uniref:Hydroxymyristoyl-ACP dehydratase n=1 Tax=Pseudaquabacterium terrae TaxID=2732868 RepID=A0ABX2EJ73_9BURK|nr:hydroxymyristoyl-ACP dehydratase [Aquabacterium terrae]NRF68691.1 hydroxymyristoyl-ACP dehydratase [Aquabacterium terrae]
MNLPPTLDHAGIAERIPHAGRMCLLDALLDWTPERIRCSARSHHAPDHPLRSASGLLAPCAIEYAAQAMALHGALIAPPGSRPTPGYLASVREVRLAVPALHTLAGELQVEAERLAGDQRQILYRFAVRDGAGGAVADGRATVVLNVMPEHTA